VPLRSAAPFGNGVSVQIVRTEHGTVTDTGPGVLTGRPEVTFTLRMTNSSRRTINLDTVQVTATYGASASPAVPGNQSTSTPFHGSLRNGGKADAQYSFAIPTAEQNDVRVLVWYRQGEPTVAMTGATR
jgi:hypothetical protein